MVSRSWSSGKFSQGAQRRSFSQRSKKFVDDELEIQLQNFEDRIKFMSMYNEIDWTRKDSINLREENSSRFSENARNIAVVNLDFLWSRRRKAEEDIVRWWAEKKGRRKGECLHVEGCNTRENTRMKAMRLFAV